MQSPQHSSNRPPVSRTTNDSDPIETLLDALLQGDTKTWHVQLRAAQYSGLLQDPLAQERVVYALGAVTQRCGEGQSLVDLWKMTLLLLNTDLNRNEVVWQTVRIIMNRCLDTGICTEVDLTNDLHGAIPAAAEQSTTREELSSLWKDTLPLFQAAPSSSPNLLKTAEVILTKLKDLSPLDACAHLVELVEIPWRPNPRLSLSILQAARYRSASLGALREVLGFGETILREGFLVPNSYGSYTPLSDKKLEPLGFMLGALFRPTPISHQMSPLYTEEPSLKAIAERMRDGAPLLEAFLSSGIRLRTDRTFLIVNNAIRALSTIGTLIALECQHAARELDSSTMKETQSQFWSSVSTPPLIFEGTRDEGELRRLSDALLAGALRATRLCFEARQVRGGLPEIGLKVFLHASTIRDVMKGLAVSRVDLTPDQITDIAESMYCALRTKKDGKMLASPRLPSTLEEGLRIINQQNLSAVERANAISLATQDTWHLVSDVKLLRAIKETLVDACGEDPEKLAWYDGQVKLLEQRLEEL